MAHWYQCKRYGHGCDWKSPKLPEDGRCPKCKSQIWEAFNKITSVSGYTRLDPNVGECKVPEHSRDLGTKFMDVMPKDIREALLGKGK